MTPETRGRFAVLIEKRLAGLLSNGEEREFSRLIGESAEAQDLYFEAVEMHLALAGRTAAPAVERSVPTRRPRRFGLGVAAALLLAAAGATLYLARPVERPTLAEIRGTARVVSERGTDVARPGQALSFGQGVEAGPGSSVVVAFGDGTRVELAADTLAPLLEEGEAGKSVRIAKGTIRTDVARQPAGRPMVFTTPHGEAKVLGTTLRLTVVPGERGSTRLEVKEGKVRFTREGKTVDVVSGHYAVAAVGVELAPRPLDDVRPGRLNPKLQDLPPNAWVPLKAARNPAARGWSGVGGALGEGHVFYFGGGGTGYLGNDVELYEIGTNAWIQATDAEPIAPGAGELKNGWGVGMLTAKGRPHTEHTHQQSCYDPDGRRFISVLTPGTWAFDPFRREWSALAGAHSVDRRFSPYAPTGRLLTLYDPDLRKVICVAHAGPYAVFFFDGPSNQWEKKGELPFRLSTESYGTYVSDQRAHLISTLADRKLRWFDARALVWKEVPSVPPEVGGVSSMAYDPERRRVVFLTGSPASVWTWDPARDVWERLELRGDAPAGSPRFNQLNYDPVHRCFLFLNVPGGRREADGVTAFRLGS